MDEEWKKIPGFGGIYEVSNQGQVRSIDRIVSDVFLGRHRTKRIKGVMLKSHPRKGYPWVALWNKEVNRYSNYAVHRLVAIAFIPNPDNLPVAHHKNHVRSDARAENLEWVTHSKNTLEAWEAGSFEGKEPLRGEAHGMAILTESQVLEIRRRWPNETMRSLARAYKIGDSSIASIVKRRQWTHI